MSPAPSKRIHWLVLLGIVVYSLLVWWPTRLLPYHWDSAGFVINATRELKAHGFLPWVVEHSDFAHPPLLMTLLGASWGAIGENIATSHMLMWVFLPILMFATYWMYLGIIRGNKKGEYTWWDISTAALCALLVGATPVVLAEYGVIYIDLPAGALAMAGLALAVHRKWGWAVASITLGGLTKEAVLIVLPAVYWFAAWDIWEQEGLLSEPLKNKFAALFNKKYFAQWFWLSMPAVMFGLWLWYHYLVTDWWLVRPGRPQPLHQTLASFIMAFQYVSSRFLFSQGRWLLAISGLIGFLFIFSKKDRGVWKNPVGVTYLLVVLAGVAVYAWSGEFTLRYSIFMLPTLVVLATFYSDVWIRKITKDLLLQRVALTGLLLGSLFLSVSVWRPKIPETRDSQGNIVAKYEFGVPEDLSYQDVISIGEQAADYVTINLSDAEIYGAFPESYQLTQPHQGYIAEPANFRPCQEFAYDPNITQILYLHPYSPGQQQCRLLLNYLSVQPVNRFESNGKWLELYKVLGGVEDASPSGTMINETPEL